MDKNIPFKQSLVIMCITAVFLIVNILCLKLSVAYALFGGVILVVIFSLINGYSIIELLSFIKSDIEKSYAVIINMILIGMIIGVWLCSGVIPATVQVGIRTINPDTFLVSAFLLCTILSIILGTGIGTISTAGIALIMISKSLSIPNYITAGAIISGSYIGTRTSIMSPITVLTANSTETDIREMIKYTLTTLIPTILLSIIIYYLIGLQIHGRSDNSSSTAFISMIARYYNTSFWLLLPPLLVIILSSLKVSISVSLIVGLISGAVLGIIFQGISVMEILKCSIFGYENRLSNELSSVFKGGGVKSILELIIILLVASAFSGLLSHTKILDSLIGKSLQKLKNGKQLIIYTILLSAITAIFGCNQLVAIVIPSKIIMPSYKKYNVSKLVLARAISDSGTILSPIIPWNVCALVPAAVMNVEAVKFVPYSIVCFLLPILNILYTLMSMYKRE